MSCRYPRTFGDLSNFMVIPDDAEDPQQEYGSIVRMDPTPGTIFHIYDDQTADSHNADDQCTDAQGLPVRALEQVGRVIIVIKEITDCTPSYTCLALCLHNDSDPQAETHWRVCTPDGAQEPHAHDRLQPLLINLTPPRAQLRGNITINIEELDNYDSDVPVLKVGTAEEASFGTFLRAVTTHLFLKLSPNPEHTDSTDSSA